MMDKFEEVAFILWKHQHDSVSDAVSNGRTPKSFQEEHPELRRRWIELAAVVIAAYSNNVTTKNEIQEKLEPVKTVVNKPKTVTVKTKNGPMNLNVILSYGMDHYLKDPSSGMIYKMTQTAAVEG